MRKLFEIGGFIAAVVLIAFGVASIVMGVNARSTVQSTLSQEQIVGSPDMTPAAIRAEAQQAGLPSSIKLPTVAVANLPINSGERAHAFASYMRIHVLEATGGQTYAEMARFATADGKGTNDAATALKGDNGQPLDNPARQLWVTETALTTALNTSYMADQLSLFGIVVGIALMLSGIGFGVLAMGGALRNRDTALGLRKQPEPRVKAATGTVQPV
jgi:F0F1-type ATP synthase membrane subunit c/vacuolar-type H+-ATPase subunit K